MVCPVAISGQIGGREHAIHSAILKGFDPLTPRIRSLVLNQGVGRQLLRP
jgi:hypothetical protein